MSHVQGQSLDMAGQRTLKPSSPSGSSSATSTDST